MTTLVRVLHSLVFWPLAFGAVFIAWAVALIRSCYMPVPVAFRLTARLWAKIVFWAGRLRVTVEGLEQGRAVRDHQVDQPLLESDGLGVGDRFEDSAFRSLDVPPALLGDGANQCRGVLGLLRGMPRLARPLVRTTSRPACTDP